MKLELLVPKDINSIENIILPYKDLETIDELILLSCNHLQYNLGASFQVEGFSLDWHTDIVADLSSILPQLPDFIHNIRSKLDSELLFFEQGTERAVIWYEDCGKLVCKNMIDDKELGFEEVNAIILDLNLIRLLNKFNELTRKFVPHWDNIGLVESWLSPIKLK